VRLLGCLAEPFMPSFSAKLYEILNITYNNDEVKLLERILTFTDTNKENAWSFLLKLDLLKEDHEINEPLPLFKKISEDEVAEFKKIYG
jgi:methionyl-tRNA synthetase